MMSSRAWSDDLVSTLLRFGSLVVLWVVIVGTVAYSTERATSHLAECVVDAGGFWECLADREGTDGS